MSKIELRVPDIGSDSAEVIELCVGPGDRLEVDDSVVVLESSKATMEVPATQAGVVLEMRVAIGDEVGEGDLLLVLESLESDAAESVQVAPLLTEPAPVPKTASPRAAAAAKGRLEIVNIPGLQGANHVTVIEVAVSPGQTVNKDDVLVVLESDKASMEIGAPEAGVIESIALAQGDEVQEGDLVATLQVAPLVEAQASVAAVDAPVETAVIPVVRDKPAVAEPVSLPASGQVHAGPAVRKIAREFGVDLSRVKGTGPKARILKEDVQNFVKSSLHKAGVASSETQGGGVLPLIRLPDFSQFGPVSRQALSKIQRVTAQNMSASWLNVPHVTQFDEADITELESFRKAQAEAAKSKNLKLTLLPFLLKACAYGLRQLPQFNVSLDLGRDEIIHKDYCHIGMAVDTPSGLVVPVIRDVDKKSLWALAQEAQVLADKAKNRQLKPAEMQGGCFTISSLGSVGGTAFTPIVNAPEVAILGVSRAAIKPVWDGVAFQPRLVLPLSLSYDHRAVNGADAARFTGLLGKVLTDIRELLL